MFPILLPFLYYFSFILREKKDMPQLNKKDGNALIWGHSSVFPGVSSCCQEVLGDCEYSTVAAGTPSQGVDLSLQSYTISMTALNLPDSPH